MKGKKNQIIQKLVPISILNLIPEEVGRKQGRERRRPPEESQVHRRRKGSLVEGEVESVRSSGDTVIVSPGGHW
jgi:hypothetical protein